MQLEVVIDGRPLVGNRTGIGVHTAEIARRLAVDPPPLIGSHAEITDRTGLEHCRFRVDPYPLGLLWQQLAMSRIGGDVVWGPHGTLPMTLRKPAVVSIHDYSSITMPGRHLLKTILSFNLFIGRSLEMAARVAAVSRAVADETMRGFGVPASRIEIVPNGVDDFFMPGGEEQDYLLYVGTLEPRKGIGDLLAAWRSLTNPPRLILAGDRGWRTAVPDDPRIEVRGFVGREELRELYRGALAFIYPSKYEGFGLPPLEAMACGAPVVATRTGAIPDYAGGVALLVPPGATDALREAMATMIADPGLRRELRRRGPERASRYRWDDSARTMTRLLAMAAGCA
ncbi:MAG TPA: glycosyltransferase family 1 protein [Thermoanaerobaculia bacterium]|nr:glycosyltransferase family 1 protein [Thermoanaerobaculia bacterium]